MPNELLPDDLLAELETIGKQLAPEVDRLYCCNLPADHPAVGGDTVAFTSRGQNVFAQQALVDQGRWRGPGATIIFCQQLDRYDAPAMLLHELGHCLPYKAPAPIAAKHVPAMMLFHRAMIERQQQAPANDHCPPWQRHGEHGLQFIRNVLHLHGRAWQAGHEVGAGAINFAGQQYGLSPHWRYLNAIGNEPEVMAGCDFQTISDTPYPDDFIQLWRDDVAAWCRKHPQALEREELLR